jgi:hypothetical protein
MTQACELGKNEPHPVRPLAAPGKFIWDLVIEATLGVQEANKVGISHGHAPIGAIVDAAEEHFSS